MSNILAIATVTESLRSLIGGAIPGSGVAGALVTTVRPDLLSALTHPGVNVFLYQVTPNNAWQNSDLPTRRGDQSLIRRPQVALDLHYLITFFGDETTYDTQRLLGATVLQLHAVPVLARDLVRQVQDLVVPLHKSTLADQAELVRIHPANLTLDEANKLWMTFPNADYLLSVAYIAGVVLIESDDNPPAPALPVRQWRVQAVPFNLTTIDSVDPEPVDSSFSTPAQITLTGRNFDPNDRVSFSTPGQTLPVPGTIQSGTDRQLIVLLPPSLRAGVNTVQLTRFDSAPAAVSNPARMTAQSNAAPFTLRPRIVSLQTDTLANQVKVVVSPPIGARQQVALLLNGVGGVSTRAFSLPAPPRIAETDTFAFDLSDVPAGSIPPELVGDAAGTVPGGTYLARIRVDGAESSLQYDADSGRYNGPTVVI